MITHVDVKYIILTIGLGEKDNSKIKNHSLR
jgi:hypothetical protein